MILPLPACRADKPANLRSMFSGLTPTSNFLLRLALTFGAGLMIAALL